MKKRGVMMIAACMFMLGFYVGGWRKGHPITDTIVVALYILTNWLWYTSAKREMKEAESDFRKHSEMFIRKIDQ